ARRGKAARTQRLVIAERDASNALTVLRIDDRRDLPHFTSEGLRGADRGHFSTRASGDPLEIGFAELDAHFHLATRSDAEQRARARADGLARLTLTRHYQGGGRGADIMASIAGVGFAELRARHANPRGCGVARGGEPIDVSL